MVIGSDWPDWFLYSCARLQLSFFDRSLCASWRKNEPLFLLNSKKGSGSTPTPFLLLLPSSGPHPTGLIYHISPSGDDGMKKKMGGDRRRKPPSNGLRQQLAKIGLPGNRKKASKSCMIMEFGLCALDLAHDRSALYPENPGAPKIDLK